jgi:hypothetical protein
MGTFNRRPLASAVKAATLAGTLSFAANPALAAFEEVTTGNPLDAITSGTQNTSLVLQDFDGDGDLDALVFHDSQDDTPYYYDLSCDTSFYENTGSASSATFTQVQDDSGYGYGGDNFDENPFTYGWGCSGYGHPVSAGDLDGDDVADFLGGTNASTTVPSSGLTAVDAYGVATGFTNTDFGDYYGSMFYGSGIMSYADSYGYAGPLLVDLDNDSDMDVIVTDYNQIRVFQNNGMDGYGELQLAELAGPNNPFYAGDASNLDLDIEYYGAPLAAGDVDNDGDPDVIMGVRFGPADMRLFINTGSASTAAFVEVTGEDAEDVAGTTFDPSVDNFTAPVMADIDNDGDDDLVVVEQQSSGPASYRLFLNDNAGGGTPLVGDDDDDGLFGGIGFGALVFGALGLLFRRRR